mgnify:CR=1 FL=1
MIESYANKLIFVDEKFMQELKQESVTVFQEFEKNLLINCLL